jgi:hypothetical protein
MTKFAKISLVAAVAVAGLTTANAQPLEEAIKGVDVSGMMRYRYEATDAATGANTEANDYRLDVKTSVKVNDIVTANVTTGITGNNGGGSATNAQTAWITTETKDIAPGVSVRDANFAISLPYAKIIAGKQSVPGPFVDNTVDDITRGTGVVALIPVAGMTLAAGTFNNTTLGGYDASEVALIGNVGGVALDAWAAKAVNASTTGSMDVKLYSLHANGSISDIALDARYSTKDTDATTDKLSLAKIIASTKVAGVDVAAGYVATGKSGASSNNQIALDNDNDAAVDAKVWQASMGQYSDASAWLVAAGTSLVPNVYGKVTYINVDLSTGAAASETLLDLSYNMSKNFVLSGKYSTLSKDGSSDATKSRIEAKYTF